MIGWLWLVVFAADHAPVNDIIVPERPPEAHKIDILVKQPKPECEAQTGEEIVVCAQQTDNESQRLRPIANADLYEKDESKAEFGISENVRIAAEIDSNNLGGGVVSKSIMARVKIKF